MDGGTRDELDETTVTVESPPLQFGEGARGVPSLRTLTTERSK